MDGRGLPLQTVACVRCGSAVPQREADYSADGMVCRSCVVKTEVAGRLGVANVGRDAIADAEIAFKASTTRKLFLIGTLASIAGAALCIPVLWMLSEGVVSRVVIAPIAILCVAFAELARGFRSARELRYMREQHAARTRTEPP